ncbi:MAG: YqiA/YcfP family alpha/beta fold hydrolase [Ignavibacteria bacterium]
MVLYIHGFASSGKATKAKLTSKYFRNKCKVVVPSLPVEPYKAFQKLEEVVHKHRGLNIIGSSLGGFYALLLSGKYNLKVALINPALFPHLQLKEYVGVNTNYSTGEKFVWEQSYLYQLKVLKQKYFNLYKSENIMLLLSCDDDLINFRKTMKTLNSDTIVIMNNSGHEFSRYREVLPFVEKFFGR